MKKMLLFTGLLLVFLPKASAFTTMAAHSDIVNVEWYQRWDEYVNGYYRTSPNNTTVDNRACYENLTKCYMGLDKNDFSKVLNLYEKLSEINDTSLSLRDDIKKQYPGIIRSQLDSIYINRYNALLIERSNIIKDLELLRDKWRLQLMGNTIAEEKKIEKLLKRWDDAYNSGRFADAIKNYEEAAEYLRPHANFSELVVDLDNNIRIAKRRLAVKEIKKNQIKITQLSPEVESAKSALGSKASIIEGLVPVIKSKDSETQQKVSLILETFKASKDEYTRNVGIYLSYLLE